MYKDELFVAVKGFSDIEINCYETTYIFYFVYVMKIFTELYGNILLHHVRVDGETSSTNSTWKILGNNYYKFYIAQHVTM